METKSKGVVMKTKYYVDENGNYLGATDGDSLSDFEIPHAPDHAKKIWNGVGYEFTLDDVKDQRCDIMLQSFNQAIAEDVTYNGAIYQSGDRTRENLVMAIANYISAANSLPANFGWIAKDNAQISFSTMNIIGLAEVIGDQWSVAFANYQTRKGEIRAVSTGDDAADKITVNAIGW